MEARLRDILKEHDLKVTPVRLQVLEVLATSEVALSHHDISNRLSDDSVDKVTLYRTLHAFAERQLIHKVPSDGPNGLYAFRLSHDAHAHFICDGCERVYCTPLPEAARPVAPTLTAGFQVTTQDVRLHGYCPDCHA